MRLKAALSSAFHYPQSWATELSGGFGSERAMLMFAAGTCEGGISSRFRAANFPCRRVDEQFIPDLKGVIETDDGPPSFCAYHGFGRPTPPGARQVVLSATHMTSAPAYAWLNDTVCVGAGEVRSTDGGGERRDKTSSSTSRP
ncbi:MAG: DUF3237 domain-containing protein [Candidatus Eremiobacteraeota bacterium]|nr:DUF3237 domain-containing protein [Candidatus Eremiobacteraeota bacterium]